MSTRTESGGRIAVLGVCVLAGVAYLVIGLMRGEVGQGVVGLAIMLAYGAVLLVWGRRSESIGLLGGAHADERQRMVLMRASAATGQVLVVVIVGAAMVSLAAGWDLARPLSALAAVGGLTFGATVIWSARQA